MKRTQLVLVLVGLTALALGGTAIAAQGHSHSTRAAAAARGPRRGDPGDDLAAAAAYLGKSMADLLAQLQNGRTLAQVAAATGGKSSAGLISALVAHERQELADAVSAGRLTQAQADRLDGMLEERVGDFVNGVRPPMPPGGHHPHGGGLEVAATYLGTSTEALATQLRSGKTLAQVASATSGKSAAGLIDALVADVTTRFGGNAPSDLRRRITDLVNGTMAAPDLRGGPGHWGPLPG